MKTSLLVFGQKRAQRRWRWNWRGGKIHWKTRMRERIFPRFLNLALNFDVWGKFLCYDSLIYFNVCLIFFQSTYLWLQTQFKHLIFKKINVSLLWWHQISTHPNKIWILSLLNKVNHQETTAVDNTIIRYMKHMKN